MLVDSNTSLETSLPLAEIALNAAIALDRNPTDPGASEWLLKLADALKEKASSDVALFPVYDRALTSTEGTRFTSKADLYARLREIGHRLTEAGQSSDEDTSLLRDFCVALHDALLNQGYLSHYKSVSNARLHA